VKIGDLVRMTPGYTKGDPLGLVTEIKETNTGCWFRILWFGHGSTLEPRRSIEVISENR